MPTGRLCARPTIHPPSKNISGREVKALGVEAQETHRCSTIVEEGGKKLLPALGVGHTGDGIAGAKSMAPTDSDGSLFPRIPRHSDTPDNGELLHNTKHLGRVKSMGLDAPAVLWGTRGG